MAATVELAAIPNGNEELKLTLIFYAIMPELECVFFTICLFMDSLVFVPFFPVFVAFLSHRTRHLRPSISFSVFQPPNQRIEKQEKKNLVKWNFTFSS